MSLSDPSNLLWITQDRRVVRIDQMEDSHLVNTIRYVERRAAEMNMKPEEFNRAYIGLMEEGKKRFFQKTYYQGWP